MKLKNRICSILLAVSIIFSSLGVQNIVYAESVEDSSTDTVVSTSAEKISESEGKEIFNEVENADKETSDTEKETNDTEKGTNDTEKETNDTEKETNDTEKETNDTDKETSDTEKETKDTEKETKDTEKETEDTEKETEDTEKETEDTDKETSDTDKETVENYILADEENQNSEIEEDKEIEKFEEEKTIVIDSNGKPKREIKDGDFLIQIEEAIKDAAGNIVGWIDGVLNGENAKADIVDGKPVKRPDLDIEEKYIDFEEGEDGYGKGSVTIIPDAEGTTYYKVTEVQKYQKKEILGEVLNDDGTVSYIEGDLLYLDGDGNETKEPTRWVLDDPDDEDSELIEVENKPYLSEEKLPGVTYDERIYYLKFEGTKLVEVRMVMPGDDDPFKDLIAYSKDDIKKITDVDMGFQDDPMQKFIDSLIEVTGVHESKFADAGEKYNDTSLEFWNKFDELPTGEAGLGGNKEVIGRPGQKPKDKEFEFVLTDEEGNVLFDKDGNEIKVTNDANGDFVFKIPVDHEGEFEFYLKEVKGNNPDIIYDGTIYKAVVKVRFDRLTNTLISEVVYMDAAGNKLDPDKIQFSNEYKPPTPIIPPIVTPPTTTNPGPDPEKPPTPIIPPAEEIIEEPKIVEEVEEVEIIEKVEITEEPEAVEEVVEESIIPMLPKTGIADISLFIGGGISSLAIGAYLLRKKD
ncbi:LPXTG cell wall anchor domain-containing protein [Anaerosphaera aminiphila]|uniref:LPXTG cell wall anchor domain-containing protein n=1 Tax=Anaerosphaera aminiphila TaxID=1120994 RepID=UPI0009F947A5|nr:LPXTG cell wall anchor domain-containing protein [Anaerosphaera aminiphila]